jgi:hypothetical protein
MKLDSRVVKRLERILEEELRLYVEYLALLTKEQSCVVALKAEEVTQLSERRSVVVERLSSLRTERTELVLGSVDSEPFKLSEVVEQRCHPADKKRLLSLISKIKDSLQMVEERSRQFNQVLNFSLGLVNGEISLLWSASQSVTRVYNAFGSMNEASQPSAPRAGSLLGEA